MRMYYLHQKAFHHFHRFANTSKPRNAFTGLEIHIVEHNESIGKDWW